MFQNFVVLGIVPGTNFQIDFQLWLLAVLAVSTSYVMWQKKPNVRMLLMTYRIRLALATHLLELK